MGSMPTLLPAEQTSLIKCMHAHDEHPEFVNGTDVANLCEIMIRLFGDADFVMPDDSAEAVSDTTASAKPASSKPASSEASSSEASSSEASSAEASSAEASSSDAKPSPDTSPETAPASKSNARSKRGGKSGKASSALPSSANA